MDRTEMHRNKRLRNRGIYLNEIGQGLVQSRLVILWSSTLETGKLTRDKKAELMGLSVATSDKVLKGNPVDRATLVLVFKNLGLEWKNEYLSSSSVDEQVESDNDFEPTGQIDSTPDLAIPKHSRLTWLQLREGFYLKVALSAVTTLVIILGMKNRFMSVAPLDGENAFHSGDYGKAAAIVANLKASAHDSDSASRLCETLRLEGDILVAKGEYADAKGKFLRALEIKKSLGNQKTFASTFEAIGDCELHLGDLEKALNMFQQSLVLYSKEQDTTGIIMAKRGIASTYSRLGRINESLQILESCQKLLLSQPVSNGRFALEADLRSRQAAACCLQGSHQSAVALAQQSLTFWKSKRHSRWTAVCNAQLGYIYQRSGDQSQAQRHLSLAEDSFRKLGDSKSMVALKIEFSPRKT